MNDEIINQVINQYTGSISNIQSGSADIGLGLFNTIAAMSIALLALNHLLRKNVDMVESNLELIRWLIYLNFFYYFIVNYNSISGLFFEAVDQIGNLLGAKASGLSTITDIKAQNLFHIGFLVAKNIWTLNVTFDLLRNFQMVLIAVLAGAVVLYCFAVIGLELMLVQIGSHIILAGGIFLLAFSGLQWTRDYAERYVHTFFHIGMKMIFIYILIGLGLGLAKTWPQNVPNTSSGWGKIIDYDVGVALSAYVYYKLCLKLPDQAVSWLTGRLSMGFDTAASVSGFLSAPKKAYEAAKHIHDGYKNARDSASGMVADMQGKAKAKSAAMQVARMNLEAQGNKTPTDKDIQNETIKTLGAARKAEWDKKVDETQGGKLAKDILAAIPKPKKTTKKEAKTGSNNEPMDYTI